MIIESTIVALSVTSLASLFVILQQRNKAKADEDKMKNLRKQVETNADIAKRRLKQLDYAVAQFDKQHQHTSLQITTMKLDVFGEGMAKVLTAVGPVVYFTHAIEDNQLVICSHMADGSFKKEYIRAGRVVTTTNSWVTTEQPMYRVKSGGEIAYGLRSF